MSDNTNTTTNVYTAFNAAMIEAKAVGKDGKANMGRGGSFNFRGIDGVMNVVGPTFRHQGLMIIPDVIDIVREKGTTSNGGVMVTVRVFVKYTIAHVSGTDFSGTVWGEANDTADKATAKAMSVALRTFLLQSMVLPTEDRDPDEDFIEHGNGQVQQSHAHPNQQRPPAPTQEQRMEAQDISEHMTRIYNKENPTSDDLAAAKHLWERAKNIGNDDLVARITAAIKTIAQKAKAQADANIVADAEAEQPESTLDEAAQMLNDQFDAQFATEAQ